MEKKITTILFDLGGVVLNLDYYKTIHAFKNLGGETFEERYSQAKQSDVFDLYETGKISDDTFRNHLRDLVGKNISDAELDNAWNAMLLDLPQERLGLLNDLKQNYRILLFSNTNAIHLRKFQEIIGDQHGSSQLLEEVFHQTYYSHILGLRKPHPEAFQAILDEQGLKADEVFFIDDSIQHIEGARSIGITAHHLVDQDIIELFKALG